MNRLRVLGSLIGLCLGCGMVAGAVGAGLPAPAPWPTHGWSQQAPAASGVSEPVLTGLDQDLATGKYGVVDSFQVFRCGAEVFTRRYPHDYAALYGKEAKVKGPLNARLSGPYNYFDPAWHPYYHGSPLHTMQSISKTVTSVTIGIAMTRGDFKASLDTPVLSYFDLAKVKNVDDRKRRMTLKDVLTMTTGLKWVEDVPYDDWRSDASLMEATDDWVQYVIDKPMAEEPGKIFNYSSGATELLSYIFKKETGQDIEAYAQAHLFAPLGIQHYWKRTPLGLVDTEGGLFLAPEDLAKIGYLFLHGGEWNGQRLVSRKWVEQSVTAAVDTGWQGLKYGFKWWLYPSRDGRGLVWMGIGFGGQRLMVFPQQQMIAVFTGWDILKDPAVDAALAERVSPAVVGACGKTS
ncbi:MAG TPA: serine hydrolase [Steroidobacteraceae bacterium]|nr:serine hydrolase [Steroidobacteraceae bacterium]